MRITELLVEITSKLPVPLPLDAAVGPGEEVINKVSVTPGGASNSATPGKVEKTGTAPTKTEKVPSGYDLLNKTMDELGVTDPYARNAILGKAFGEAGGKLGSVEIPYTYTSNDRIREVLPQFRNLSDQELDTLKKDERAFFNRAYGGVLRNTDPDDGYKYRGRGLTGITGKSNYQAVDDALGLKGELVKNPDLLLNPDIDRRAAVWYYKNAGITDQKFDSQGQANSWAIWKAGGQAYRPGTDLHMSALRNMAKFQKGEYDPTQLASLASTAVRRTNKQSGGSTLGAAGTVAAAGIAGSSSGGRSFDVVNTRDDEDDFQERMKKLMAKKKKLLAMAKQRAAT